MDAINPEILEEIVTVGTSVDHQRRDHWIAELGRKILHENLKVELINRASSHRVVLDVTAVD